MIDFRTSKVTIVAGLALLSCSVFALSKDLFTVPHEGLGRNSLWHVINDLCVPSSKLGLSFPCVSVTDKAGSFSGWAILNVGANHILTVPTRRMIGIESQDLLNPQMPNLWNVAWQAQKYLAANPKGQMKRDRIVLAVNSARARSQDQLHIHTGCLRTDIAKLLAGERQNISDIWSVLKPTIKGNHFKIRSIEGEDLSGIDVVSLLPDNVVKNSTLMSKQTLGVVGTTLSNGKHGFYILNGQAGGSDNGRGEALLDTECRAETKK